MKTKITIWTIGHSTRTLEEMILLLTTHHIQHLVDVRSIPRSRLHPQFNKEAFAKSLAKVPIRYTHLLSLGGYKRATKATNTTKIEVSSPNMGSINTGWQRAPFRHYADYALTEPFKKGLYELIEFAKEMPTAIMCSEAVWWRCHRRIITDYLLVQGVKVLHIMSPTSTVEATMTTFAKVTTEKNVIYPN